MSDFNLRVPIQIRFSDLDSLGRVAGAVYQIYYVQSGIYYFNSVILQNQPVLEEVMVMATITVDYLRPILGGASIAVETRISAFGHKSFKFNSRIIDLNSGKIYSQAHSVSVCLSRSQRKSIPLPELWRRRIMAFEKVKPLTGYEKTEEKRWDGY
jgi:acyl-CoA thioester hydrolase